MKEMLFSLRKLKVMAICLVLFAVLIPIHSVAAEEAIQNSTDGGSGIGTTPLGDYWTDGSEAAKSLWNQTQKAHAAKHWSHLKFLVSLVDEVVAGTADFAATPDGLAELREACAQLEAKGRAVAGQIAALKATVPFTYAVLLEDPLLLERKQNSLNKKIRTLKAAIEKYERTWNNG